MIEINLLPGKKKRAAPGAGFKFALPDFGGLIATIRNPWLIAASATSAVVIVGAVLLFFTQTARLRVAEARLDAVRVEKRRFDAVIAQKRQSERIRDSLAAEINIIRGIDADRYVWPHILDQVTKALPPYTWLTGVSAQGVGTGQAGAAPPQGAGNAPVAGATDSSGTPAVRVWLTGVTVDIQAYTTFLRQLAASPWLTDVSPATSSTVIEADRSVTAFNVSLRYKVADSVYIGTVPLARSVWSAPHGAPPSGPAEPVHAVDHPGHGDPGLSLLDVLGDPHCGADRDREQRDRQPAGDHRQGEAGSRERHGRGPAPQGRAVPGAAQRDAPARAREERGAGADRRHLDPVEGPRGHDRPVRAVGGRVRLAVRHVPLPPRDSRPLRPARRVSVGHREPAPDHRTAGCVAQAGAAAGAEDPQRYHRLAARGPVPDPHIRQVRGDAARAQEGDVRAARRQCDR